VVVGGDIVPGPMPVETLELLRNLDIPRMFIRGNGDRAVSETKAGKSSKAVPEQFRPIIVWCADQLTEEQGVFLAEQYHTLRIAVEGLGDVVFCHATPRDDTEIFTRQTSEDRLLRVFKGTDANLVVCGHTHMQFDRMIGGMRVVNAGSVGAPFGHPGAYWLLLGPRVEMRKTDYDYEAAAAAVRNTDYPARDVCAASILQPEPEEEILRRFRAAELTG